MNRFPTLFLAHGSPMLALENTNTDTYVEKLAILSKKIPKPKAILSIWAHWYGPYKHVDVSENPKTIYDFYGFPDELYKIEYSAPGYIEWRKLLEKYLPNISYHSIERGIDHGAWSVLRHLYGDANIPIFSISIDSRDSLQEQFELGKKLRVLRDEGILIITNGNIVHNLSYFDFSLEKDIPYDFGGAFDAAFKERLLSGKFEELLTPGSLAGFWESSPTLEHYIPAIITLGTSYKDEKPQILYEGFEGWSVSRFAFGFGV